LWVDRPPATIARVTGIDTLAERLAQVDADTLFDELAARLERIVPFDASLFFGTDPATLLATFPARIDGVANNQCHAYWQREFLVEDANLFRDLARAPIPANTLWAATDNLPARSARYREFLRPERFGDELRVAFRVAGSAWGVASLMRGAGCPPFTREEAALVTALSEPVGRALRRVALDRPPAPRPAPTAPGLMLFDRDGELLSANNEARIWLGELDEPPIGPRPFGSALPTEVVGVIAGARAVADGCSSTPARLRLRSPDGRWLLLHATALRDMEGERGSVAVVIEPARGEEIAPIIVEAYGLSTREQEVTGLITRGVGTADIAATLFLSPHTVRDHVKAVFEKAGVSTRGELTAKLFAEHYAPPLKSTARHVDGE
jgi:DNA-binding CsgD family transcriptional regulator